MSYIILLYAHKAMRQQRAPEFGTVGSHVMRGTNSASPMLCNRLEVMSTKIFQPSHFLCYYMLLYDIIICYFFNFECLNICQTCRAGLAEPL